MFDLKTWDWDGFSKLPKEGLDYLLDTTAINKRLKDNASNPYRWREGTFHVPRDASKEQKRKISDERCGRFLEAMGKKGLILESRLDIKGPFPAYDLVMQGLLLDKEEYRVRAIFSMKVERGPRYEVPAGSVRQDPDQKASLVEVAQAAGMKPVSLKERRRQAK